MTARTFLHRSREPAATSPSASSRSETSKQDLPFSRFRERTSAHCRNRGVIRESPVSFAGRQLPSFSGVIPLSRLFLLPIFLIAPFPLTIRETRKGRSHFSRAARHAFPCVAKHHLSRMHHPRGIYSRAANDTLDHRALGGYRAEQNGVHAGRIYHAVYHSLGATRPTS